MGRAGARGGGYIIIIIIIIEVFVGSVGRGVQWDVVTEYHVVPVRRCRVPLNPQTPLTAQVDHQCSDPPRLMLSFPEKSPATYTLPAWSVATLRHVSEWSEVKSRPHAGLPSSS